MIEGLLHSRIFLATILAWFLAQGIKNVIFWIKHKRIDFRLLLGSGGMPSSHSATVSALAISVGKIEGWGSSIFVITLIFAFIIMTDAIGVRRSTGQQAKVLNKMVEDLYKEGRIKETRLKELIGHTPFEVIVGASLGICVGLIFTSWGF
jgi:hypothetical protein